MNILPQNAGVLRMYIFGQMCLSHHFFGVRVVLKDLTVLRNVILANFHHHHRHYRQQHYI